jgi:hypothetical protein
LITFLGFGTSMTKIAREFSKINSAKEGYYLANILDKKYYYCGHLPQDVRNKLIELGVSKKDLIAN